MTRTQWVAREVLFIFGAFAVFIAMLFLSATLHDAGWPIAIAFLSYPAWCIFRLVVWSLRTLQGTDWLENLTGELCLLALVIFIIVGGFVAWRWVLVPIWAWFLNIADLAVTPKPVTMPSDAPGVLETLLGGVFVFWLVVDHVVRVRKKQASRTQGIAPAAAPEIAPPTDRTA